MSKSAFATHMDSRMDLYLLRHGRSVANERNLVCGASDYPLSATGFRQAETICQHLRPIGFTRIYCSPLSRARDTIASLSDVAPISIDPLLAELDTGDVSHITLSELWTRDPRYQTPWLTADLAYPGGERFADMFERIKAWYSLKSKEWNNDEIVLVVGHEGTLRSIYSYLMDLQLKDYPSFPIGNCNYFYFKIINGKVHHHTLVAVPSIDGAEP